MRIISKAWAEGVVAKLDAGEAIDVTTSFNKAIAWLIEVLSRRNIPFKLYQLGAGVKRVTTDTDCCPMCKRKLE